MSIILLNFLINNFFSKFINFKLNIFFNIKKAIFHLYLQNFSFFIFIFVIFLHSYNVRFFSKFSVNLIFKIKKFLFISFDAQILIKLRNTFSHLTIILCVFSNLFFPYFQCRENLSFYIIYNSDIYASCVHIIFYFSDFLMLRKTLHFNIYDLDFVCYIFIENVRMFLVGTDLS